MSETNAPILLAQCKAYHPIEDIIKEIETLFKVVSTNNFKVYISLPYSYIEPILKNTPTYHYAIGAETMLDVDENSFTASIAGKMLEDVHAKFVLIGTPEERFSHGENTHHIKNKIKTALRHNIQPIVCFADTLQQHQDKESKQVLIEQVKDSFEGLTTEEIKKVYLAYIAEWISRTPWEASSSELQEAYSTFREAANEALGPDNVDSHQLILAIPGYSQDTDHLIESLKSHSFLGYSLGILSASAEYLHPLSSQKEASSTKNDPNDNNKAP